MSLMRSFVCAASVALVVGTAKAEEPRPAPSVTSPDNRIVAITSGDTLKLVDAATQTDRVKIQVKGTIQAMGFSPDGKLLAGAGTEKSIGVWDAATGKAIWMANGHTAPVNALAFSPDGKFLASGGDDKTIHLWNLATGKELRSFAAPAGIRTMAFSADGKVLSVSDADQKAHSWDVAAGKQLD
jgi:WD40 repeat protein